MRQPVDFSLRLPGEWKKNMNYKDQCWIGKTLFCNTKGTLASQLKNWWYPPPQPSPNSSSTPCPDEYFLRRLFLWMPKRMWKVDLKCPRCTDPERSLQSKGLYTRVRMVLDVKDFYYLAAEYHFCNSCKGTFIAWDSRLLEQLSDDIRALFPVVLTYKYACDISVISLLRARSLGNSSTSLQKKIHELHSEEWMRKCIAYLSKCKRHRMSRVHFNLPVVTYQREKAMKNIPSAKWFLACYVRDVYNRLDILKAAATSVYGTVLKIDSTKKITKKLQGVEAASANWVTNVGNERGEIVMSVVTSSESTSSLKPMADGLVKRFAEAGVQPPLILYTDRDCCGCQEGPSRFNSLFSSWASMVVRLDIFHFMRRLGAGCTSESHPLYGVFMGRLARCIFEWDAEDLTLLYRAKRGELKMAGVANPSEEAVRTAVTKEEMARHCRRRTRGSEATSRMISSLMDSMSMATDALGVPLFRDDMLTAVWPEQKRHVSCIQDPPGIPLYTVTGHLVKGGVKLPVLRCARGSTSLESFHLHLARFIPGAYTGYV